MAFFEFPHSRTYDSDLGWLIKAMKEVQGIVNNQNSTINEFGETLDNKIAEQDDRIEAVEILAENLRTFVNDYFDNLDVQEEINNKITSMAADGSLLAILEEPIEEFTQDKVAAWLTEHITPTSPPVDSSLTIQGAAADAKATGDAITELNNDLRQYGTTNSIPFESGTFYPGSLTIVVNNRNYSVSGTTTGNVYYYIYNNTTDLPAGITPGGEYYFGIDSDPGIQLDVYQYVNGEFSRETITENTYKKIAISSAATGLQIRLRILPGTYNSALAAPYMLTTLSKPEVKDVLNDIDTRMSSYEDRLSGIESRMPTAKDDQLVNVLAVSMIHARVNGSNQLIADDNYDALIVPTSIAANATYWAKIFNDSLAVAEIKLYTFNATDIGSVAIDVSNSYNAAALRSRVQTTAAASYFILVLRITSGTVNDALNGLVIAKSDTIPEQYQPYYLTIDEAINAAIDAAALNPAYIKVGTDADYYKYISIDSAVQENPNKIICVDYGTYETEVTDLATDKMIIGADRTLCVLTGTDKDYDTPPIEIAGGVIKHFTVNMINAEDASHKGYCLHSDNANCANNSILVEDCTFACEGQHTIGMGIYPGETVIYKDCEFIFKDEETTPAHAPFFAHNSGASDGRATVRFHNCIFRGYGYALKLSSYSSNCIMGFEFIDCTFESDTLTGDEMIWTDYVAGDTHDQSNLHRFTGKMPLLNTSHGNNVDAANYTA